MKFVATGEVFRKAVDDYMKIVIAINRELPDALDQSGLDELDITLAYCPSLMISELKSEYPEQSEFSKKKRTYYLGPQLDYEAFKRGSFDKKIEIFCSPIVDFQSELTKLGATQSQTLKFVEAVTKTQKNLEVMLV